MKQVILGTVPSKSNSYRIGIVKGRATLVKSPSLEKYENDFYIQCNLYRGAQIQGYFEIILDVFYPNQRSDLDNSFKIVLDCLQRLQAISNDNKLVRIVANKYLDKVNPRIEFVINKV